MLSIICVYNNKDLLENYLLKSLKRQSIDFELILLDNTSGKFNSAARALNSGGKKSTGQYLMFVHQDFAFDSDTWLEETEKTLNTLNNLGIAGVAGKSNRNCISNIKTGFPPILAGTIQIKEPKRVQTLDECIIIIPKKIFEEIQFDDVICDNWHLYATDYCLTAGKAGYNSYVIPCGGYHVSPGFSFSEGNYYLTLKKLIKKHRNEHEWIYTTTGSWSTVYPLDLQILYQKLYYCLGLDKRFK